jgi:NAD(P)-dependent dehydrogenase (short-subunit alcohol dehydrogenase family)
MKQLFDLSGQVAIVTGSSKGIGRSIAEAFAEHGARVVVSSRKAEACEEVVAGIRAEGGEAISIPCHAGKKEQLENLIEQTRKEFGPVDILVANAAVNPFYGSTLDIPDSAFQKTLETNILATHWLTQLVIPEMRERKHGVILIVSSVGGLRGSTVLGAYATTKAANMQMARNIAAEFGPDGIRANCLAPGLIKTDFARALYEDPRAEKASIEGTPLRRLGEPDDCAGAAVFLASRAGSWITGQTIVIDGGVSTGGR